MNALLAQLRWAAFAALLMAGAGIGAALHGIGLYRDAVRVYAGARSVSIAAQQRLGSVYIERREIDDYLPRYGTLRTLGALDNENRLDWIERIAAIRDDLRLPRLAYVIEPRQANSQLPAPGAGLGFETSRMRLEFTLIHEGDLLRILERLRTPAIGVFEIRSCVMNRTEAATIAAPSPGLPATPAGLVGGCQLDWISLVGAKVPDAGASSSGGPS